MRRYGIGQRRRRRRQHRRGKKQFEPFQFIEKFFQQIKSRQFGRQRRKKLEQWYRRFQPAQFTSIKGDLRFQPLGHDGTCFRRLRFHRLQPLLYAASVQTCAASQTAKAPKTAATDLLWLAPAVAALLYHTAPGVFTDIRRPKQFRQFPRLQQGLSHRLCRQCSGICDYHCTVNDDRFVGRAFP